MRASSQPFAGVGVTDREHEEREAKGDQDQVHHRNAPCRLADENIWRFEPAGGRADRQPARRWHCPAYVSGVERSRTIYESHTDARWPSPAHAEVWAGFQYA